VRKEDGSFRKYIANTWEGWAWRVYARLAFIVRKAAVTIPPVHRTSLALD
jgi:hypothetical protein